MNKLHQDCNRFQNLSISLDPYLDALDPHIGELKALHIAKHDLPISRIWTPVPMQTFVNEGTTELADVSIWHAGNLILSAKALEVLSNFLMPNGEILPLASDVGQYFFYNCLRTIQIDPANITARRVDGEVVELERIDLEESDSLPSIFKASPGVGMDIFCSDSFRTVFECAKLKGIYFTKDLVSWS